MNQVYKLRPDYHDCQIEKKTFDKGETVLLCKEGAYSLFLIEDASEIVRQLLQNDCVYEHSYKRQNERNLEYIIQTIIDNTLPNQVEFIIPEALHQSGVDEIRDKQKQKNKINELKKIIKEFDKTKIIVILLSIDISDSGGGHYGIIIHNPISQETLYFDSMSSTVEGNACETVFCEIFGFISKKLFEKSLVKFEECISKSLRQSVFFQITGGFLDTEYQDDPELYITEAQDTRSQNHFCYMWSIWYLHLKLMQFKSYNKKKYSLKHIIEVINEPCNTNQRITVDGLCIDPIFIIKRYINSLLIKTNLIRYLNNEDRLFYDEHFKSVWTNFEMCEEFCLVQFKTEYNKIKNMSYEEIWWDSISPITLELKEKIIDFDRKNVILNPKNIKCNI